VPSAEAREIGPVVGVGAFGCWRVVRDAEILLEGPREGGKGRQPVGWGRDRHQTGLQEARLAFLDDV
jgi:hypothetical protein